MTASWWRSDAGNRRHPWPTGPTLVSIGHMAPLRIWRLCVRWSLVSQVVDTAVSQVVDPTVTPAGFSSQHSWHVGHCIVGVINNDDDDDDDSAGRPVTFGRAGIW